MERKLWTSTDPEEIARARKMGEERIQVKKEEFLSSWCGTRDAVAFIQDQFPDLPRQHLCDLFASREEPEVKAEVACQLGMFGYREESLERFFAMLSHSNPAFRRHAIEHLGSDLFPGWEPDAQWSALLLKLLDDAQGAVVEDAIELCCRLDIDGAFEKLVAKFPNASLRRQSLIINELLKCAAPVEVILPLARTHIAAWCSTTDDVRTSSVTCCLNCTHEEVWTAARDRFREMAAEPANIFPDVAKEPSNLYYCLLRFLKRCDASDVPLLRRLIDSARDKYQRKCLVERLLDFLGVDDFEELVFKLTDSETIPAAAKAVGRIYAGTRDRLMTQLLTTAGLQKPCASAALAILAIGTPEAREMALEVAMGCYAEERTEAVWGIYGMDLQSVKQQIVATGIITAEQYDQTAAHLRTHRRPSATYIDPPLHLLLWHAGLGVGFTLEHGEYPVPHDDLAWSLCRQPRNKFAIEAISQEVHRDSEESIEGYTLRFIANDRLYMSQFETSGDYFNFYPVVNALHAALADAGREDRYITMWSEFAPCEVAMLFATAKILDWLIRNFELPLHNC